MADDRIASLTSQVAASGSGEKDEASDDEIFAELEKELDEDFDMGALRERRLDELRQQMNRVKNMREEDHGKMIEILDEKDVIRVSASEKLCVIHFYHRDFKRCDIMNSHLEKLAPKYFATKFAKVFVENVPWLVERLQIKVLPCVLCFVDGVTKDRLIGFEDLGNSDGFETAALELRLQMSGVLEQPKTSLLTPFSSSSRSSRIRKGANEGDSDSD